MKKICASMLIIFFIFSLGTVCMAATANTSNVIVAATENDILEVKNEVNDEMDEYAKSAYGGDRARSYSIQYMRKSRSKSWKEFISFILLIIYNKIFNKVYKYKL